MISERPPIPSDDLLTAVLSSDLGVLPEDADPPLAEEIPLEQVLRGDHPYHYALRDPYADLMKPLPDEEGLEPRAAVARLFDGADFVFMGITHQITDERYFIDIFPDLYRKGVESLAVEFVTDEQRAMDHFLQTDELSIFSSKSGAIFRREPGLKDFFKAAQRAGLRVMCVDQPFAERSTPEARDRHLASHMEPLGRSLVWLGNYHAKLGKFPNARSFMHSDGFRTAGVKIESDNALMLSICNGAYSRSADHAIYYMQAFRLRSISQKYFSRPLAFSTSLLGGLMYIVSPHAVLPYANTFDLVVFLSSDFATFATDQAELACSTCYRDIMMGRYGPY